MPDADLTPKPHAVGGTVPWPLALLVVIPTVVITVGDVLVFGRDRMRQVVTHVGVIVVSALVVYAVSTLVPSSAAKGRRSVDEHAGGIAVLAAKALALAAVFALGVLLYHVLTFSSTPA